MGKSLIKKTADGEVLWPYHKAEIDGYGGGTLGVELNRDQKHFDYDVVSIVVTKHGQKMEIDVSRDELAQIILSAYEVRKEYQDALKLEAKELRYNGLI